MQQRTLVTADTHFLHGNIIRYCNRPFSDRDDMTQEMIRLWNDTVRQSDDVFHLGDFAILADAARQPQRRAEDAREVKEIFRRLNGRKHLVEGNHDEKCPEVLALPWASRTAAVKCIKTHGTRLTMHHYAMRVWQGMEGGGIHLYGHTHARLPGLGNSMDIGVDNCDYRPLTIEEIKLRVSRNPPYDPYPAREVDREMSEEPATAGMGFR